MRSTKRRFSSSSTTRTRRTVQKMLPYGPRSSNCCIVGFACLSFRYLPESATELGRFSASRRANELGSRRPPPNRTRTTHHALRSRSIVHRPALRAASSLAWQPSGVLTHAAAVDRRGRHLLSVLEELGASPRLIFRAGARPRGRSSSRRSGGLRGRRGQDPDHQPVRRDQVRADSHRRAASRDRPCS